MTPICICGPRIWRSTTFTIGLHSLHCAHLMWLHWLEMSRASQKGFHRNRFAIHSLAWQWYWYGMLALLLHSISSSLPLSQVGSLLASYDHHSLEQRDGFFLIGESSDGELSVASLSQFQMLQQQAGCKVAATATSAPRLCLLMSELSGATWS